MDFTDVLIATRAFYWWKNRNEQCEFVMMITHLLASLLSRNIFHTCARTSSFLSIKRSGIVKKSIEWRDIYWKSGAAAPEADRELLFWKAHDSRYFHWRLRKPRAPGCSFPEWSIKSALFTIKSSREYWHPHGVPNYDGQGYYLHGYCSTGWEFLFLLNSTPKYNHKFVSFLFRIHGMYWIYSKSYIITRLTPLPQYPHHNLWFRL